MKTLKEIIELVHEIDKALDAYEYNGYTYEQYLEAKSKNIRGERSLRNLFLNNRHIWNNVCENTLSQIKSTINDLYRNIIDKEKINKVIPNIQYTIKYFKKSTDDYSMYPFQSELIGHNLSEISKYIYSMMNYEEK